MHGVLSGDKTVRQTLSRFGAFEMLKDANHTDGSIGGYFNPMSKSSDAW